MYLYKKIQPGCCGPNESEQFSNHVKQHVKSDAELIECSYGQC